jgi:flagellar hook-length control protein FliK
MSASAAAMSAAATGLVVSNGDDFAGAADAPSFTADAMVSPGARAVAGTQAPNGAPALAATRAAAATAAHANAQAASALADADASDKHAAGGADPAPLPGIPGDAGAGAAQSVNPSSVTDSAPAPTLRVPAGVDTPEFGQGIADRVSWMVDNNLNGAKLQVNPPQLGPIEVRISVQGGHAQVWFTSHSAVARDALESSSPKLREMLGAQGFGQVSVDISQGSFHERPAYSQPYDWTPSANRGPTTLAVQSTAVSPRASSGALDAYA